MRFSFSMAGCAVVMTALLAACSNGPQGSQPLPSSGMAPIGHPVGAPMFMPHGKISRMELLKLQAEGKLAGPVPIKELQRQLAQLQKQPTLRINVRKNKGGKVAMWTSMTSYNALLGVNKKGTNVVAAINVYNNGGCEDPIGVKIDHSQNIWVGCEYESSTSQGTTAEYNSSGTEVATYNDGCPLSGSQYCSYSYGYNFDTAENSSYVFNSMTFFEYDECTGGPSCTYVYGGGFEYFPAGSPSSTPKLIPASPYGSPVDDVYYMDLDSSGNIWFDYYGCTTATCGYGLAEITNPTTSPTFVSIEAPGFLVFAGGVYASNSGNTINVIDQDTHMVYQFNTSGTETGSLGPTAFGLGDPVTGGFNSSDKNMAIGDADDWLNIGTVSSNKWTVAKAALFISSLEGAAYTPSDK